MTLAKKVIFKKISEPDVVTHAFDSITLATEPDGSLWILFEDCLVNRFSSQPEVHSEALSRRRGREDGWGRRRMTTLEGQ